jgi:hypothetical protein
MTIKLSLSAADHVAILAAVAQGATIRRTAQTFRVKCLVVAEIVCALGEPAHLKRKRKNCEYYMTKHQDPKFLNGEST